MGRWAQRKRAGGGPSAPSLTQIDTATLASNTQADLFYNNSVTATDFDPATFTSSPSGVFGTAITQAGPNEFLIDLTGSAAGDDEIQYTGSVSGVLTPQSVQYI
jgi:hypothetical protein